MVEKSSSTQEFEEDPNRYYEWSDAMQQTAEILLQSEPDSSFQPMI